MLTKGFLGFNDTFKSALDCIFIYLFIFFFFYFLFFFFFLGGGGGGERGKKVGYKPISQGVKR